MTFFAQNLDTNNKIDENAINIMFELEKKLALVSFVVFWSLSTEKSYFLNFKCISFYKDLIDN